MESCLLLVKLSEGRRLFRERKTLLAFLAFLSRPKLGIQDFLLSPIS